ncbi:Ppx/GppA phosphatase family protein [Clostridium disporicum]|uniref:Ppx/GppA phosphatase n=1 Tax=Clostridium disporicum TaxID=84024 RepID=A0A174JK85_9CLOT|nr:Ppx/GppA phosphatase family protein [Clostridium disporicum]CUP00142.1 Ppx/GppA phosphatase [Clostridium disporicum]
MVKIGIIHISSSSLRLVLAEIEEIGYFRVVDELKTPMKICYNLNNTCKVCNEKLHYIISTLKTYESLCLASCTSNIIAIATNSFNQICDNEIIVKSLKDNFDLDLRILTPKEEIYYNYLGIVKSLNVENSLVVEITGTSTNLTWVKDGNIEEWSVLPFGNINLTYNYGLNDRILSDSIDECNSFISNHLKDVDWLNNSFESIILIGDVGRNIAKIDKKRRRYPFDNFNNYELLDNEIHELYNMVKSKDLRQRRKIEGLEQDMADTIFTSLAIFHNISDLVSSRYIKISNHSLREGILYEFLDNNYDVIHDILDYSLYGILHSLNCNIDHANQVYKITLDLFNALKPLHHLDDNYLNILKTSSLLHDCGISINYLQHHKHSFYIILNSYINVLNHKELLMSAAIAASHRFNNYQIPVPQFSSIINKLDLKAIYEIGALLKIAEGLDRSLVSSVKDVEVTLNDEEVIILLSSPLNLDVEIHQALRARDFFREVYDRDLIIRKK